MFPFPAGMSLTKLLLSEIIKLFPAKVSLGTGKSLTFFYSVCVLLLFACGLMLYVSKNIVDTSFCIVLCPAVPRIDIHGWMDAV
jgi:hypothetical protein